MNTKLGLLELNTLSSKVFFHNARSYEKELRSYTKVPKNVPFKLKRLTVTFRMSKMVYKKKETLKSIALKTR